MHNTERVLGKKLRFLYPSDRSESHEFGSQFLYVVCKQCRKKMRRWVTQYNIII